MTIIFKQYILKSCRKRFIFKKDKSLNLTSLKFRSRMKSFDGYSLDLDTENDDYFQTLLNSIHQKITFKSKKS